jgi:hypothetical protein
MKLYFYLYFNCKILYTILTKYLRPMYFNSLTHFWDKVDIVYVTLLFEQWIIFKNLQFILEYMNFNLFVLGLKTCFAYFWSFVFRTTAGLFKDYLDFQNFHLTTRLRWPYFYTNRKRLKFIYSRTKE